MRLLIWKSYGDIEVYTTDEHGFFERMQQAVRDIFLDWDDERVIKALDDARDVDDLVDAVSPHVGTHECFEMFELSRFKNYTLREVRE